MFGLGFTPKISRRNMLLLKCSQLAWQKAQVMNDANCGAAWYKYKLLVHGTFKTLFARNTPMFARSNKSTPLYCSLFVGVSSTPAYPYTRLMGGSMGVGVPLHADKQMRTSVKECRLIPVLVSDTLGIPIRTWDRTRLRRMSDDKTSTWSSFASLIPSTPNASAFVRI